jgi:hypothetical protein
MCPLLQSETPPGTNLLCQHVVEAIDILCVGRIISPSDEQVRSDP